MALTEWAVDAHYRSSIAWTGLLLVLQTVTRIQFLERSY